MRKILTIICTLMLAALLPAAMLVSRELPADTRPYVESKYAGWNGVLQAWICTRWSPGASFISWLNSCAADFEKAHNGVYIEFTPVEESAMRTMHESGIPMPDMVFFSPGVLQSGQGLTPLDAPDTLREEFQSFESCLPVAMGGYIWVYNRALCPGPAGLPCTVLPDDAGRSFSAAMVSLLETGSEESKLPQPGLDLGLPANAGALSMAVSSDALESFINGETEYMPITQKELARLIRLRDAGRGPDWECHAAGSFAWADQLLLSGIPVQTDGRSAERAELCREFLTLLIAADAQQALAGIGAFSVTGEPVHAPHSPYADLDALLSSRPLAVPEAFSEHSAQNAEAILRAYLAGEFSAEDAIAKMGLRFILHNPPN